MRSWLYLSRLCKRKKPSGRRIHVAPSTNQRDFTNFDYLSDSEPMSPPNLENFLMTPSPPNKIKKRGLQECCICLEQLYYKKTMKMNQCHHEIHISCVKEWFKEHSDCPLCRTNQDKLKGRIGSSIG